MANLLRAHENRIQGISRKGMAALAIIGMLSACVAAERAPSRTQPAPAVIRPMVPAVPVRPAVARAPIGLENLLNEQWRVFPGRTGVAIMRIDGGE